MRTAVLAACAAALLVPSEAPMANRTGGRMKEFRETAWFGSDAGSMTEDDLIDAAAGILKERYGKDFVIEEEGRTFTRGDGRGSGVSVMRAYAHPKDDSSDRFYVIAENGRCRDNYSALERRDEVEKLMNDAASAAGLTADARMTYSATETPIPPQMTAEEILLDDRCVIRFEPELADEETPEGYVDEIRKWMDFLYRLDCRWYMEAKRKSDGEVIFTLDPGDDGFSGSGDWSDSLIAEYVEDCLFRISETDED